MSWSTSALLTATLVIAGCGHDSERASIPALRSTIHELRISNDSLRGQLDDMRLRHDAERWRTTHKGCGEAGE